MRAGEQGNALTITRSRVSLGKKLNKEEGVSTDGRKATRFLPGCLALDNSGRCGQGTLHLKF